MFRVEEIAKKKSVTMAQIAVAWSLSKDGVTAPIVGTTKLENLKEMIGMSTALRRRVRFCHNIYILSGD
jgi:aryl-alcohol dehydrogenase-like predicted oxidoreductase